MAHERRSDFVLSTTISELILLLFFLLLLLFGHHYVQAEKRESEQKDQILLLVEEKEKAEAGLRKLYDMVGQQPKPEEFKTLVAIDKLDAILADKEKFISKTEARIQVLNEILNKLKSDKAFVNLKPADVEKFADVAFCEKQNSEASLKDRELDEGNRRNKELTERLSRCGGKGEEFVSCWRGPDGKIEYVFETRLTKAGIEVSQRWTASRDQEMGRFPAERSLVGRTVQLAEFLELTTQLFADSVKKSCRYYVVISGRKSEMNAEMFTNYHRVQDHFYRLVNLR